MHKNEVMNRFGKEPSKLFIITEIVVDLVGMQSGDRFEPPLHLRLPPLDPLQLLLEGDLLPLEVGRRVPPPPPPPRQPLQRHEAQLEPPPARPLAVHPE